MSGRARGMTLLELLVVIFIISILMGLGIEVISRISSQNRLEATRGGIRSLLRRARNASLQERFGAVVSIDPRRSVISAQLKTNITALRFEPAEVTAGTPLDPSQEEDLVAYELTGAKDFSLQVEDGALYDPGRTGSALLFARPEAWAWFDEAPILRPLEGLHVEVWVLPGDLSETLYDDPPRRSPRDEERHERAGTPGLAFAPRELDFDPSDPPRYHIVRRGRAWALALTANYELEVTLSGVTEAGVESCWVARTKPNILTANTWYRLELAYHGSGRRPRLVVDGIGRALYPLEERAEVPVRLLDDRAPLSLSDSHPDRGFFGMVDELRLAALVRSEEIEIPGDIVLVAPQEEIAFDVLGQLDPARHPAAVTFYLCDDLRAQEIVAPVQAEESGQTMTQAEAEARRRRAANLAIDEEQLERFRALLAELPEGSWAEITVERTGLVR